MTQSAEHEEIAEESSLDSGIRRRASAAAASLGLFAATAVAMAIDVAADLRHGSSWVHLTLEATIMVLALAGAGWFARELRRHREALREARARLRDARDESERWRREAERWRAESRELVEGLGRAIEAQFDRWGLSPAEREVALLLLKGLSLKEVAAVRGVAERTARQQALAVYRKAGLSGRAELSAFFLEDLLAPRERAEAGQPALGARG